MKINDVEYVLNPSFELSLDYTLRKRNGEPKRQSVNLQKDRDISDLLLKLAALGKSAHKLPRDLIKDVNLLIETRLLVPADEAPQVVRSEFLVTNDILDFVPQSARAAAVPVLAAQRLVFNSANVFLQRGPERPRCQLQGLPPERNFPFGKDHLWVFDPGTRMWATYRMGPSRLKRIQNLAQRKSALGQLEADEIELLFHARVLVPADYGRKRAAEFNDQVARMQSQLMRKQFVVARGMIHPLQIAVLRRYFRELKKQGYLPLDPRQVRFKRHVRHNDPLLRFLHRQSGHLVRAITGEAVLPSYTYLSAYCKGAVLKRHIDRDQCVWNGSMLIDQEPEVDVSESWPIYLETERKVEEVRLDFGDTLFYSGTELPHWRKKIPDHHTQTLALLHYVPLEFVGDLD